jgi:hypothetical protein
MTTPMERLEALEAEGREQTAFRAGMNYALASLLESNTGHHLLGQPLDVIFSWPHGDPPVSMLRHFILASKAAAERYQQ